MRNHSDLQSSHFLLAGALLLGVALIFIGGRPLDAQSPSPNALTVKLLDPIDSAQASAGQRFHAAVAKDTAVAGVFLAKGAAATITLAPGTGGYRWTLNLIEITVDGKVAGVLGQNPKVVPSSAGDFSICPRRLSPRETASRSLPAKTSVSSLAPLPLRPHLRRRLRPRGTCGARTYCTRTRRVAEGSRSGRSAERHPGNPYPSHRFGGAFAGQ